jgi:glycerol-3-phosphate dehydrogenase
MNRLSKIITTAVTGVASLGYLLLNANNESNPQKETPPPVQYKKRREHLKDIASDPNYDIVVIGGGCNGAGVLLDASTRGFRALLIEKDDFASGASSKSTKLIHGGVRYLQQVFELSLDSLSSRIEKFNLVKEAISERSMMIDSAPHLTTKIPFVIPCTNMFNAFYYYIGSMVYYMIYLFYSPMTPTVFKMPYFLNREELTSIFPNINPKYDMGVVYEDGSFNDSRMVLSALLTASLGNGIKMPETFRPANIVNKAEFVNFIKDKEEKIVGVTFRDSLTKKEYTVNAKYVVNCTGAWADKIRLLDNPNAKKRICLVAGSHITYDKKVASGTFGICIASSDGRITLVVPWLNRVIAGTTEHKLTDPTNNPVCTEKERKFINDSVSDLMSEMKPADFLNSERARWSGIRPLVVDDVESETKKITRNHVIEKSQSGLLSLMGGKWTTYRHMGEDLVNQICQDEKAKGKNYPDSLTKGLPLIGSALESYKT